MLEQEDALAFDAGIEPGVAGLGAHLSRKAREALAEDVAVQVVGAGRVLAEGFAAGR